jgi:signal transduction histidine kinase/GAF domain-containing protein
VLESDWRVWSNLVQLPMKEKPDFSNLLAHLAQVGAALSQVSAGEARGASAVLQLIQDNAALDIPGAALHIYPHDGNWSDFNPGDYPPPGPASSSAPLDEHLARSLASRAIERKQRVIVEPGSNPAILPSQELEAVACWPLFVAGKLQGLLFAQLRPPRPFTESELLILENYAQLSGLALSAIQQSSTGQQETARRERELRRLRRAGMLISSKSSLKGTLEIILRMALEVTEAQYGIFRLVDESGTNLVTLAIAGDNLGKPAVEMLPIDGNSIMGIVALQREPLIIPDLSQEPWRDVYYPFDRELVMLSELAVPLIGASGRLEGVLNLESPHLSAFSKQDRYILQIFATQAVIAIQEARLLSTLREISELLLLQPLHEYHQTLVARACDLLNVSTSHIWLRDQAELLLQAGPVLEPPGRRIPLSDPFWGLAVRSGQPVFCAEGCVGFLDNPAYPVPMLETGFALAMPLLPGEEQGPLGVFSIANPSSELHDEDQAEWYKKVLSILGYYALLAIQYHTHQETLRSVQEQKALAETFAAVGDLSVNLMHSLNNKIGTIPVRVESIQAKSRPALEADPYLAQNLEEIQRNAAEAIKIVQENLFHLRPIQLTPVTVAECVQEALSSIQLPPGVRFETQGLEDLPPVLAGRKRLAFVFANLIENSLDAIGGQGQIRVAGLCQEEVVEIRVADDGPGIDPALHERIFEFNYSTRASDRPEKLGFGLWWVKTLIVRFGGTLSVESDGRHGTTFCFTLPFVESSFEQKPDE